MASNSTNQGYTLHSCGHFTYTLHSADMKCQNHSETEPRRSKLTLTKPCRPCQVSNPARPDYQTWPKDLAATVTILRQDLFELSFDGTREVDLAMKAVDYLFRISHAWALCTRTRPGRKEMVRYISFTRQCITKAGKIQQAKKTAKLQRERVDSAHNSPGLLQMSEGTVSRQVGDPSGIRAGFLYPTSYNAGSPTTKQQRKRHWHQVSASLNSSLGFSLGLPSPTLSVITNPFSEAGDAGVGTGATTPELDAAMVSREDAAHKPKNMVRAVPRDEWACDFCGAECFCEGIPW